MRFSPSPGVRRRPLHPELPWSGTGGPRKHPLPSQGRWRRRRASPPPLRESSGPPRRQCQANTDERQPQRYQVTEWRVFRLATLYGGVRLPRLCPGRRMEGARTCCITPRGPFAFGTKLSARSRHSHAWCRAQVAAQWRRVRRPSHPEAPGVRSCEPDRIPAGALRQGDAQGLPCARARWSPASPPR